MSLDLANEVKALFGHPVKIYREYAPARDSFEFTIFCKLFGRRARFDVEIYYEDIDNDRALDILMAQLPEQIIALHERDVIDGFYKPYFGVARNDITGIVGKEGGKVQSWIFIDGEQHILEETDAVK